jgi:putative SOS response-associated peptidase YedK
MCYDIKASCEAQLKRAQRHGDHNAIEEIKDKLIPLTDLPLFHVSGFSHPKLLIYTSKNANLPEIAIWGLIPEWIVDEKKATTIWNKTLNARSETLFKKPSFKASAVQKRCLLFIDGFFEHHYHGKKSYPFYIHQVSNEPIGLACLWSEWLNMETSELIRSFTIVTREANPFMANIHNNPKLEQPRMPLIVPTKLENAWLEDVTTETRLTKFINDVDSVNQYKLSAHTVGKLRGKKYVGNSEDVTKPYIYKELTLHDDSDEKTLTLF